MKTTKPEPSAIVIPFGKHKGATVAELLAKDPSYADWIMAQGWVSERFAELHATIATRGAGTDDTPEHNALQARFLDTEFRAATLSMIVGLRISRVRQDHIEWIKQTRERDVKQIESDIEKYSSWGSQQSGAKESLTNAERKLPVARQRVLSDQFDLNLCHRVQFETRGVDVSISWWFELGKRPLGISDAVSVELKPSLGDDYPSVMRQMKRLGCHVCVAGQYTGRGVSELQLRQMFEANGQTLIFVQEIEEEARKRP